MSDYTELQKAAAYAAQDTIKFADEDEEMRALQQFHEEVDPETVLALIAENDQLKKDRRTEHQSLRSDKARNSLYMMIATSIIDDHPYERTGSDWDYEHPIHDKIISLLAERDQLKAENDRLESEAVYSAAGFDAAREEISKLRAEIAGLKAGYEAYERVNAELKAEVDGLRKDSERLHSATVFVQKLCDYAGKQPRVATGYLHDILAALGQGERS